MAKMKAVQVPKAGADFEIVEREIPQPGAGQVVQACGICHSDVITKEGLFPGITCPRVPRCQYFVLPPAKKDATICAVEHHILRRKRYVSEKRPICGCRAHHGGPGLLPRRGNLLGGTGRECERRPHLRSKVALQALESGLGHDKTRQKRSERACASSATDHAVGHIPCQYRTTGVCDSLVSGGEEVSGQLQHQGMHVGGSFSSSV